MQTTIIPVGAGAKVTSDLGYLSVTIEPQSPDHGGAYRLDFPQTAEDLVLACDTLIAAIERVRAMAPDSVR